MIDYDISGNLNSKNYIFFLHGFGGDKNSFKLVENHIAGDCNMVFISFPGFGKSPPPQKPYSVFDYTLELKELINSIAGPNKINIVCHSFGARVAIKLCAIYPNIINKLVIVDGAGLRPKRGLKYKINILRYKRMKKLVNSGKKDEKVLEKFGSSDYKSLPNIMKATFVKVVNEDLKRYLKKIKCETLIIWGKKDKETPLYMAKKFNRFIENSGLYIINNAGHFSYLDNFPLFINAINLFFFS